MENKLDIFQLESIKEAAMATFLKQTLLLMKTDSRIVRFFELLMESGVSATTLLGIMEKVGTEKDEKGRT